ncbi:MAG: YggT family protein [Prochlorotrichaceae cyanobacterium]
MNPMTLAALPLGFCLGGMIFCFIFRIVLSWYPQVEMNRFPLSWVYGLTEPFLSPTRKLIPPLGGVDITPIVWVGVFSLLREILLGQQGLITLALYY